MTFVGLLGALDVFWGLRGLLGAPWGPYGDPGCLRGIH